MGLVTLVSGGLDSTLLAILAKEAGLRQFPLFVDYGQLCKDRELEACIRLHKKFTLPEPAIMDISGFGGLIPSGLTDANLRINEDAFLPGRNLLFLLVGCSYAYHLNCNAVAIGLLSEESHIFPDQTSVFLLEAQKTISLSIGREIQIVAPLMDFNKLDVLELAQKKGITGTYSCHAGTSEPCGKCVSCSEMITAVRERG